MKGSLSPNIKSIDVWASKLSSQLFRWNAAKEIAPITVSATTTTTAATSNKTTNLVLYEYESSPWCRLVREQLSVLDLNVHIRPCPRESLWQHGAYSSHSTFRPDAMEALRRGNTTDDDDKLELFFPILVDATDPNKEIVIQESFNIIEHLWSNYGKDVDLPSSKRRPDQVLNSLPFVARFLLLVAPSVCCRPTQLYKWLRAPNVEVVSESIPGGFSDVNNKAEDIEYTLYQSEACASSRLVREILCSLEVPYCSISCAQGTRSDMTRILSADTGDKNDPAATTPVLVVSDSNNQTSQVLRGHDTIAKHLWERQGSSKAAPSFFHVIPDNLGQNSSYGASVYAAILQGQKAFLPAVALK